jgi:hypothetical protein
MSADTLSMNDLLEIAGIETVLTGGKAAFGRPEKALTNGVVCIYRPDVSKVVEACKRHFGVDIMAPLAVAA